MKRGDRYDREKKGRKGIALQGEGRGVPVTEKKLSFQSKRKSAQ